MLHAAVFAPLSLWAMTTGTPRTLSMGAGHGSEMFAGYALAVIAGFLLPQLPRMRLLSLFALWLAGRGAAVAGASGLWIVLPNVAFAAWIALLIVPRLAGSAKKLRNMATGPLVGLIATSAGTAVMLLAMGAPGTARAMLYITVTLLAGLMLFMGGRVIVPAVSGAFHRHGERLATRVQPRMEGAMLLCLIVATAGMAVPALRPVAAMGAIGAGAVSWVRLLRWRMWRRLDCIDLWGLGVGYAWVASGMVLLGTAVLLGWPAHVAGLHAITVGGLGTLSLNIMGRTWLFRPGVDPARVWALACASALVSLAAVSRLIAIMSPAFRLNWLAAAAWSLAFFVVLVGLWFPIWRQRLLLALE